ncbi:MAG TPA: DUF3830 family protein [Thermoanaerobaculia bacterium]|nr:DUF3830 family protein [Thermoanaerobaculia bacterium]
MVISIWIGGERFEARFEEERAPRTCRAFRALLPWREELIHARWSGEACWVPLGSLDVNVTAENAISDPRPGQILFYPGGISEAEVLIAYGEVRFAAKAGPLAGNPLLRITRDLDKLAAIGRAILRGGARTIVIDQESA